MPQIEKQLLNASPYKPFLWKRFIDDIFSVWTISETEINKSFIDLANSFQANIKFTHEVSSKHIVFLDTEVLKDHDSFEVKSLMFKDILSQQKHSNTSISPHATLSVLRKALLKGEALRLTRDIERGYPQELVETILAEVRFQSRKTALQNKPKTSKKTLPFVTTFSPVTANLKKKILMKHWHLITGNNTHAQIYPNAPVVAYRKEKSLKVPLVRAKIPPV